MTDRVVADRDAPGESKILAKIQVIDKPVGAAPRVAQRETEATDRSQGKDRLHDVRSLPALGDGAGVA